MGTLSLGNDATFSGSSGGLSNAPSGTVIKNASYVTGHGVGAKTVVASTNWTTLNINGGTGQVAYNITKPVDYPRVGKIIIREVVQ